MNIKIILTLVILTILTSSCIKRQVLIPVDRSVSEYRNFPGLLQVEVPQGNNWFVIKERDYSVIYGKKLENPQHTFIASLTTAKLNEKFTSQEEFFATIKRSRSQDLDPSKFSNIEHSEVLDNKHGEFCTKFRQKADEIGKGVLEVNGYTCMHPVHNELMFTIAYSERTNTIKADNLVQEEGIRFIESLNLNKYNK